MKNKRNVIIAFILICCLCLSIGYAALTDTLYVTGTADVTVLGSETDPNTPDTPFEEKFVEEIYWSAATSTDDGVAVSRTTEAKSGIEGANDKKDTDGQPDVVTITIDNTALTAEGESVTINATVMNGSDYDINAVLSGTVVQNEYKDYFSVTWDWATGYDSTIGQGEFANVIITVKLENAPTEDITDCTINMTLTATAAS